MKFKKYFLTFLFWAVPCALYASEGGEGMDVTGRTSLLIIQLGLILFAAWVGNVCFKRLKLPGVLGEIVAGVVIGPYCLGQIPLRGFEGGIFPLAGDFAVSVELYSFATVASIILLFLVGLETNIETFIKFSFAGSVVGTFGVIFSFIAGDVLGIFFSKYIMGTPVDFLHPIPLFLGIISTATSVGITARILSDKKKMNSPEGVTILAAAVIDDVLGIILLAVVLGMVKGGQVGWKEISMLSLKAFCIWLGFTLLGLRYAHNLSGALKKIRDRDTITVLSFGLALLLAGVFEKSGLAMIIGAYVMGLSLSKTDLSFIIQEKLEVLRHFFVPVFFCVMGMLVNLKEMASGEILLFGLFYVIVAVLGKLIGCSIPALFLNFNLSGALRVGVGMIPRGEVALIIAGIGISSGIIDDKIFSLAMLMTFATTLIAPLILDKQLDSDKSALKRETVSAKNTVAIDFTIPNPETEELVLNKVIATLENEGFFVSRMGIESRIYYIRKNTTSITLQVKNEKLSFDCLPEETTFINTLFYEVIAELEYFMQNIQSFADKEKIGRRLFKMGKGLTTTRNRDTQTPFPSAVACDLKGNKKEEIIKELVDLLISSGHLSSSKRATALKDVLERESKMSTGMQEGIALPHAKTKAVNCLISAVGLKRGGVDFDSLDKKPSVIFLLILAPENHHDAYLQFMAEKSRLFMNEPAHKKILASKTNEELQEVLRGNT